MRPTTVVSGGAFDDGVWVCLFNGDTKIKWNKTTRKQTNKQKTKVAVHMYADHELSVDLVDIQTWFRRIITHVLPLLLCRERLSTLYETERMQTLRVLRCFSTTTLTVAQVFRHSSQCALTCVAQRRLCYCSQVPYETGLSFAFPFPVVRSSKWVGLEGLDERTSGSLIPETLQGMEQDEEFQLTGIPSPVGNNAKHFRCTGRYREKQMGRGQICVVQGSSVQVQRLPFCAV